MYYLGGVKEIEWVAFYKLREKKYVNKYTNNWQVINLQRITN